MAHIIISDEINAGVPAYVQPVYTLYIIRITRIHYICIHYTLYIG